MFGSIFNPRCFVGVYMKAIFEGNPKISPDGIIRGGMAEKNFGKWQAQLRGAEALWNLYLTTPGYTKIKGNKIKVLKLMKINSSAQFGRIMGGESELGALRFNQHCIEVLMKRYHTRDEVREQLHAIYGGENMKMVGKFRERRSHGMYATGFDF